MSRQYRKTIMTQNLELPREDIKITVTVDQHMDELTRFNLKIAYETPQAIGSDEREYKT